MAAPSRTARPLAEGYYLANFETLLADVERRSGDLLADAERAFLYDFRLLSLDARRLYVRLVSRRGPWFRLDRLRYGEISGGAADELCAAGFGERAGREVVAERLALLRREELLELALRCGVPEARRLRKLQLVEAVAAALASEAEALASRLPILRLLRVAVLEVLRLLFFGNLAQDWTEFVLQDLGVLRFEAYALSERAFADRAELEQHLALRRARERAAQALAEGDLVAAVELAEEIARRTWRPTARRLADGVLLPVGRALERSGAREAALRILSAAWAPPARERRARLLTGLGRAAEALALCREIGAQPRDEGERVFADRFGDRLRARLAADPQRRPSRRPAQNGVLATVASRILAVERSPGPVEAVALTALAAEGLRGFFAENWLWRTLFGLAFWDLLYAPVPGAFVQPFQYGPRDLYDGFRAARAAAVEERLEQLAADPRPGPALLGRWDEKLGTASRLVHFAPELRPHLELAACSLSGAELAAVCDRLSRDLRRHGKGFPDLFLVDETGRPLLAEVKAPADELRPEQRGWLEYFERCGIRTVVLRLRWAPDL